MGSCGDDDMGTDRRANPAGVKIVAECQNQITQIRARMKELKEDLKNGTTLISRAEAVVKLRIYRQTIESMQDQIAYYNPNRWKHKQSTKTKQISLTFKSDSGGTWDALESGKVGWSDLSGHSWEQVESGDIIQIGASGDELYTWMAEGSKFLHPKQRLYIDAYYNEGYSVRHIGILYGVAPSTVSRTINRGLRIMQRWINAKKAIQKCTKPNGQFDWVTYIRTVDLFTIRQKEVMLLILAARAKTRTELAEKLEIHKSTITRTCEKIQRMISTLGLRGLESSSKVILTDWENANRFNLASQTNMPTYFYFQYCFKDHVGGVTRYRYEIAARKAAGMTTKEIAEELDMETRIVRDVLSRTPLKDVDLSDKPVWDDTIAARIDADTWIKLRRMVISNADS